MSYQHKENDTIYQGREAFVRIDNNLYQQTGEVKIVGEPIEADEVIKKVNRKGFEITYLAYFIDLFDKLGAKEDKRRKIKVKLIVFSVIMRVSSILRIVGLYRMIL